MRPKTLVWLACLAALTAPRAAAAQNPVRWSLAPAADAKPEPGKPIPVVATATIDEGWHLYAMTEPPGPIALTFALDKSGPFALAGAITESTPTKKFDPNFNLMTEFHEEKATFTVPVAPAPGTPAGTHTFVLTVTYQTCNDRFCLPPKTEKLQVELTAGSAGSADAGSAGPPATEGGPPAAASGPPATPLGPPAPSPAAEPRVVVPDLAASSHATTLGAYVGLAVVMGALSLMTPCVFPMVPITVSYFTNRAGRGRRAAVMQALVYGLGIILTFTAVGFTLAVAFGASGLNRFAADPWLNLGVTALFLAFALSLFGAWDLALPSRLVTAASNAESGRGAIAGTLLMGLAFTLTSFTCTAPFLGTLLVVASQGDWQWPLAGMIAFSTIFALPFVLLALAPNWLASLPRSGPWLVAVKAVMGLLELAAAMKFLSNVDLVWHWGIFTRPVVLVAWTLIALVMVGYLVGLVRIGHAPRLSRPGVARWTAVAAGVVLGLWLASGLTGRRLGELEAFLPPADLAGMAPGSELRWIINDYDAALAEAKQSGRPVLIDFTGYTCTNCRWMEANMFPRPDVSRELARYVRLRLYTDGQGEMYQRYQQLEQAMFDTVALPYYAVLRSDGTPVVAFGGLTRDSAEYVNFLRKGLE
jgi:thiol:disulfide interchange protein DsbD